MKHHPVAHINPHMGHRAGAVIGSREKDNVAGLCLGGRNDSTLVVNALRRGTGQVVDAAGRVHPADDDSIVRGTQLRDTAAELINEGAKEVHMRIACPPLIYACPFVNFSASKSELELITRRIIQDFEGDMNKNVEAYATTDSPEYQRMVDEIARRLKLSSLKFSTVETIVKAIGLPKCKVCTHCFDGSSFHTLK